MTIVFRVHLTGLLLLSYAALFNSMSVQKLSVNSSSKVTLETKSTTMPEISLNGAKGVGIMYSRGAGSASKDKDSLNLHNVLRRDVDPPAANMPKLVWSSNLARLAELWSRHCIMGYGLPLTLDPFNYSDQILQNIWTGGRNGTIEDALSSWLEEGNSYNFKTRACYRANGCKNYLTIISASVHEVGCGLSHCNGDVIVVCYYGARDYKSHQSPYAAGKPCSQCGALEWCDSGLCRSPGEKLKGGSLGTSPCVYKKTNLESNDGNYTAISLEDGSHLERQRRHTTEEGQKTCNVFYTPLFISIGILVGIVGFGLLIGIFYMLAHICKDRCTCCSDSSDGCCLWCYTTGEGQRSLCCKKGRIKPEEGTSTTESILLDEIPVGSDSPDANVPDPVHAATLVDVEYRDLCTNTDPEPRTIDRSTGTEHDLLDTNDVGTTTSGDLKCIDAAVQVNIKVCTNTDPEPRTIDRSTGTEHGLLDTNDVGTTTSGDLKCIDAAVQVNIKVKKYKHTDETASSNGVCLVHNCQTCDLHKTDMRQVEKLRTENIKKLIKASKNTNLAPGTYII